MSAVVEPLRRPDPSADPAASPTPLAPVRTRLDGWTPQRQHDFIEALADTGSVARAALAVGMSRESAYRLRRRPDARAFAEAWHAAQDIATRRLADACLERAIHGEEVPVFHNGELIGHRVRHSDALAIFLLRMRDPLGHGPLALPPRSRWEHIDTWLLNPIPRALKALPRLLGRLLGGAPARPEDHVSP